MGRTIAIGDIHGCGKALSALIEVLSLQPEDTIVALGDYVDRGADSQGVLDQMLQLRDRCQLVPLLGNHDQMMLDARCGGSALESWLNRGGQTALASYGLSGKLERVPAEHFRFLAACRPHFETQTHIFLHANFIPELPLAAQDDHTIRWLSLRDYVPTGPHCSGKTVVLGHTPQAEVLDLGYLVCIDTGVANGGWLTALDVDCGRIWQADQHGLLRSG